MTQLDSEIVEPPPEILSMIKKIAPLIAQRGTLEKALELEKMIRHLNQTYENSSLKTSLEIERSSFLKSSDPYHAFYRKKLNEYLAQYQNGTLYLPDDATDTHFSDLEDLPDRDHPPLLKDFSYPAGITLMELGIIKLTAQFVARYGECFWVELIDTAMSPQFSFMKLSDSRYSFFKGLVVVYQRVLSPHNVFPVDTVLEGFLRCLDETLIDLHALVAGVDCFAHMDDADYFATIPPPQPLSVMMMRPVMPPLGSQLTEYRAQNQDGAHRDDIQPGASATLECVGDAEPALGSPPPPLRPRHPTTSGFPARITHKELGIIKLTAQFVARYGRYFRRALMMRVVLDPRFQFMFFNHDLWPHFQSMEPDEIRFHIFSVLVDKYSRILMPSEKLEKFDACPATVLEVFFLRLERMIELHASVAGIDYFAHMDDAGYSAIMAPPEHLSAMMNRPKHMHPGFLVLLPLGPPGYDRSRFLPLRRLFAYTFPPRITLKELAIIKLTAQFALRYGMPFVLDLMSRVYMEPEFEFLKHTDSRGYFYGGFLDLYCKLLKPSKKVEKSDGCRAIALQFFFHCLQLEKLRKGVETSMIELHAFLSGVDYFARMDDAGYSAIMPPPQRLSVMMKQLTQMHPDKLVRPPHRAQNQDGAHQDDIQVPEAPAINESVGDAQPDLEPPPLRKPTVRPGLFFSSVCLEWLTPMELVIIKLTALFVVRYGMLFCRDLMKKVAMKPQSQLFKFMVPTDRRFHVYDVVVDAYSKILKPSYDAYTVSVLEGYFHCLQWEKLEEGVPMTMDDLNAFVGEEAVDLYAFAEGVNCFAQMEDDYYYAIMANQSMQRHCSMLVQLTQMQPTMPGTSSRPEEPEAKRQKFVESGRVPEDRFLAPPGSSMIKVSVPTVDGGQVIEIAVKSLSENVASLKEIIARVMQMPTNNHKLSGKAGDFKNNKSLADYNVGAGEILTLSPRISRWT